MANRKLLVYIAASVDGYIAQPNDDLSFLALVEKKGEDYGYAEFIKTIDTVIVGRKTYDWVLQQVPEFSHADKETYVITHEQKAPTGNVNFYNGNLKELVSTLKSKNGKNIFCDGGAQVVNALLNDDLVDEMTISLIPVMVGAGTRLFNDGRPEQRLELVSVKTFDTGLVQLHYKRRRA